MAINISKTSERHVKYGVAVHASRVDFTEVSKTGKYDITEIRGEILVEDAYILIVTPYNSGTASFELGTASNTDAIIETSANAKSAAGTILVNASDDGVDSPKLFSTGFVLTLDATFTGAVPTAGEVLIVVKYIEIDKNFLGEFTDVINAPR